MNAVCKSMIIGLNPNASRVILPCDAASEILFLRNLKSPAGTLPSMLFLSNTVSSLISLFSSAVNSKTPCIILFLLFYSAKIAFSH